MINDIADYGKTGVGLYNNILYVKVTDIINIMLPLILDMIGIIQVLIQSIMNMMMIIYLKLLLKN